MLNIKLICLGRLKEKYFVDAFAEYEKRLLPHCRFELAELSEERLPAEPSAALIDAALSREAVAIKRCIPQGAFTVALCLEGKLLSSEEFAALIGDCTKNGTAKLCFVVGSSFGLSQDIKTAADLRLSMSKFTFPHHLARVILAEQIYRGIMINEGSKYHK